jgi:hypothetical protein
MSPSSVAVTSVGRARRRGALQPLSAVRVGDVRQQARERIERRRLQRALDHEQKIDHIRNLQHR